MTDEERKRALEIVDEYQNISTDIERVVESLDSLTLEKDLLMKRLEQLKSRESDFMKEYRNKYGNRDLLVDLKTEMR